MLIFWHWVFVAVKEICKSLLKTMKLIYFLKLSQSLNPQLCTSNQPMFELRLSNEPSLFVVINSQYVWSLLWGIQNWFFLSICLSLGIVMVKRFLDFRNEVTFLLSSDGKLAFEFIGIPLYGKPLQVRDVKPKQKDKDCWNQDICQTETERNLIIFIKCLQLTSEYC